MRPSVSRSADALNATAAAADPIVLASGTAAVVEYVGGGAFPSFADPVGQSHEWLHPILELMPYGPAIAFQPSTIFLTAAEKAGRSEGKWIVP
jgi:hypothetical protein